LKIATVVVSLSLATAALAHAEEGMWTPSQIPDLAPELRAAGLEMDPARLADLTGDPMGAVVWLGGCTGSFVSPDGLIVTNHHCSYRSLQYNSTPERDLLKNGFLAASRSEEVPTAPGSYVYVTTGIRDVTSEVTGSLDAATPDAERARIVKRRTRELVDACEKPGGVRCRVASFYEGSQFLEVTQMEIRDVRLVYAPPVGIGNFGGEIDNWMWPRHTGDFSFQRAYVGPDGRPADPGPHNVPYHPAHWLKVSTRDVHPGDFVLVLGYPGRTFRYETSDQVAAAHEFRMPEFVRWAHDLNAILEQENHRGRDIELANYSRIRRNANTMKNYEGVLASMADGRVEAQRRAREKAGAEKLAADPKLAAEVGDPVGEIRTAYAAVRRTERRDFVLAMLDRSSPMLGEAVDLWRMAEESAKPDLDREEGFRDRDRKRFEQARESTQRSIEPASDRATLRYFVQRALELPAEQRIGPLDRAVGAAKGSDQEARIESFLDGLYAGTRMADLGYRRTLEHATTSELAATGDTMIGLARELAPLLAERRATIETFDGAMLRVGPRYMDLLRAVAGGRLYPDANSTLRMTWGHVRGYSPRDAVRYEPQTTLAGVLAKSTGEEPFDTPPALIEAAKSVPEAYVEPELGSVPVDFLSTVDTTGGNSGSPTLNGHGELVGLLFDGTIESVVADYLFEPKMVRSIHAGTVYMRWVMDAVDGAHALLREMGLPVETPDRR
jgi:hypothetical protein